MTDRIRTRIAASVTALFIAAICAAGVATHRPAAKPSSAITTVTGQRPRATAAPVIARGEEHGENDHE